MDSRSFLSPLSVAALLCSWMAQPSSAFQATDAIADEYEKRIRPILKSYCQECHSDDLSEAEVNFEAMHSLKEVRRATRAWQRALEVTSSQQMPPKDAAQPSDSERAILDQWIRKFLTRESQASAGDPGPVVLRRLNNTEYTYTIRDLTGVDSLSPAKEFPVDSAAGEGFTNTGNALVMSPALVSKYLDAGKEVAAHAVLLPDGIEFSPSTSKSDWTNNTLDRIRQFYNRYAASTGGDQVNLQGIVFDTNQGGRLPLEQYIQATLRYRDKLKDGSQSIEQVARECNLNAKYLNGLWTMLNSTGNTAESSSPSSLLDTIRHRWHKANAEQAPEVAQEISRWQQALWRFTSVGHIGKVNGPKAWQETTDPIASRQELRWKIPENPTASEVVFYMAVGDAGDGNRGDLAIIERPRLVAQGRPDILLKDIRPVISSLSEHRKQIVESALACLQAADEASRRSTNVDIDALATQYKVDKTSLSSWLEYLGIGASGQVDIPNPIDRQAQSMAGYDFVKGWVGDDALSIVANSSDQHVRIPGNLNPHSVAIHPSPTLSMVIGWKSPIQTSLTVSGTVQHAHPECGNGVAWSVELRRGNTRQRLANGIAQGGNPVTFGPIEKLSVYPGDLISIVFSPRDGNHSCDLTMVDMILAATDKTWTLSKDISSNILEANPHSDSFGNSGVWHFYSEPVTGGSSNVIPTGSLLAQWQSNSDSVQRETLAKQIQTLLRDGPAALDPNAPDAVLYRQLTSVSGPLFATALRTATQSTNANITSSESDKFGFDPALFGKHPDGSAIESASLCVPAPALLEIRLPSSLVAGTEFVASGLLHPQSDPEGSVQFQTLDTKPAQVAGLQTSEARPTNANGAWTDNNRGVVHSSPIIVNEGSRASERVRRSFDEFRQWFPVALCYTKIVPVDEVVTLTLFYREDDQLQRLMLNDDERRELDRLWSQLHFISGDALKLVDAYEQLWQFATQDADPSAFEPLREPIKQRAAEFRTLIETTQPVHVEAVVRFAEKAFRRPLAPNEADQVRQLYSSLRQQELQHEDAIRLMIARILVSPTFLYRLEKAPAGNQAQPVDSYELANRLSYLLWSSAPDQQLLDMAKNGRLQDKTVLVEQTRRMLADPRARRFATEFFCQWLHILDFDQLDEKSERHFRNSTSCVEPCMKSRSSSLPTFFRMIDRFFS